MTKKNQYENTTSFLLKRYAEMSGSRKIEIGMTLSAMVKKVRAEGKKSTGS